MSSPAEVKQVKALASQAKSLYSHVNAMAVNMAKRRRSKKSAGASSGTKRRRRRSGKKGKK